MSLPTAAITVRAYGADGSPLAGARVAAQLSRAELYEGFVVPTQVKSVTDANGVCVLDLWPNGLGTQGSYYALRIDPAGMPGAAVRRIHVPDLSPAEADDLVLAEEAEALGATYPLIRVDAIMAVDCRGMRDGQTIEARGRTVAGDGGGGVFTYSQSSGATVDGAVVHLPLVGVGRLIRQGYTVFGFAGTVRLAWFGADASGVSDSSDRIAAWLGARGTRHHIDPGTYRCTKTGTRLVLSQSMDITGEGKTVSVLLFDDESSTTRRDFLTSDKAARYNLRLSNLGIQGTWGAGGNYDRRSHLVMLENMGRVDVRDVRVGQSRQMGFVVSDADTVSITGSDVHHTEADGFRSVACQAVIYSGNTATCVNDDSFAVHSKDYQSNPVTNDAIIIGNKLVDSQGIAVLGAKRTVIQGNSLTRPHTRGILVDCRPENATEGNTAGLAVIIAGNVIESLLDGSHFAPGRSGGFTGYITLRTDVPLPVPGSPAGFGFVGSGDGAGRVVAPHDYFFTNDTDTHPPQIGNWWGIVANNQFVRLLKPGVPYSSYGYGLRYSRRGPVDLDVTEATLGMANNKAAVWVQNHAANFLFADNLVAGTKWLYHFDGTEGSEYTSWTNVVIRGGILADARTSCIHAVGTGQITLDGLTFDGDPYHQHPARAAAGCWTASYGDLLAINCLGPHITVRNCAFRNVGMVNNGGATNLARFTWAGGNTIHADPVVASGYNAANAGIATVQRWADLSAQLVVEDCDPGSATFGRVKNTCTRSASAMPTDGKYPQGWYVSNSAQEIAGPTGGRYVVTGWLRLTTGSAHVLGTDWQEISAMVDRNIGATYTGKVPAAFGWDYTLAPISTTPTVTLTPNGRPVADLGLTPEQLFDAVSTARSAPGATYYVNGSTGSDSNPGTSSGSPLRSIWKAVSLANAGGKPTKVVVVGGGIASDAFSLAYNPSAGGTVHPTVDIAFLANGVVCTGVWEPVGTPSLDATYGNCYNVTAVAAAERVLDMEAVDRYGQPVELSFVPTAARCNITPDSWTMDAGRVLVNRRDGLPVTSANTRVTVAAKKAVMVRNRVNVYFGQSTSAGRWVIIGGGGNTAAFDVLMSGAASVPNVIAARCVHSLFASTSPRVQATQSGGAAFAVEGLYGTAMFVNCHAHGSSADSFTAANAAAVSRLQMVTLNCTGTDTGRPGTPSCNHLTGHNDNVWLIDAGGSYQDSRGGMVRDIQTARRYMLGTWLRNDAGNARAGGTLQPVLVRSEGSAQVFAEAVQLDGSAMQAGYSTNVATAYITRRNCQPGAFLTEGTTVTDVTDW